MRALAVGLALLLVIAVPLTAGAQRRGGGGGGGRGGGGFSRPPAGGGFNFNHDARPAQPVNRPPANNGNHNNFNNNSAHNNYNNNSTYNNYNNNSTHNNYNNNSTHNNYNNNSYHNNYNNNSYHYNNVNYNRAVVVNPVYHGPAWGWNHGVAWYPAPTYWGGGFWGAMAIGATSAAIFGSLVNASTNQTVTSYQVQPSSPGATLLSNYGLTQTQCGGPNLVNIYGPNNSAICAYPNNTVSAGNYSVNASNLTIVSA
jgi:hypothetical protein